MKARNVTGGTAPFMPDLGASCRSGVSQTPQLSYRGRKGLRHPQKRSCVGPEKVSMFWRRDKSLAPSAIRTQDCQETTNKHLIELIRKCFPLTNSRTCFQQFMNFSVITCTSAIHCAWVWEQQLHKHDHWQRNVFTLRVYIDGCDVHRMGHLHGHSHKHLQPFSFIYYFRSIRAAKNICQNSIYFRSPVWYIFSIRLEFSRLSCSSGVPCNFVRGGGSTNSVEDREQKERGSGGCGRPLVRGSGGSCNLVQEISFHIVKFS